MYIHMGGMFDLPFLISRMETLDIPNSTERKFTLQCY